LIDFPAIRPDVAVNLGGAAKHEFAIRLIIGDGLDDVRASHDVGLERAQRIRKTRGRVRLGSQMKNAVKLVLAEEAVKDAKIEQIAVNKGDFLKIFRRDNIQNICLAPVGIANQTKNLVTFTDQ